MKKSTKISLVLLTSTAFLTGCSTSYPQQDCEKDQAGNCIDSSYRSTYRSAPIYHTGGSAHVSNITSAPKSFNATTAPHFTSVSRGGFGSTAHFSVSS